MKKLFCFILVLATLVVFLTGCNFAQSMKDALIDMAESQPKAEEMIEALSYKQIDSAKALLHPDIAEESNSAIYQLTTYFSGHLIETIEIINVNLHSSVGTDGTAKEEKVTYKLTQSDGDIIHLSTVYRTDNNGSGFVSFQLVLGLV